MHWLHKHKNKSYHWKLVWMCKSISWKELLLVLSFDQWKLSSDSKSVVCSRFLHSRLNLNQRIRSQWGQINYFRTLHWKRGWKADPYLPNYFQKRWEKPLPNRQKIWIFMWCKQEITSQINSKQTLRKSEFIKKLYCQWKIHRIHN